MDYIVNISAKMPTIRTEDYPYCPLCSASGDVLYEGLKDALFDVPGIWNHRRCTNTDCRHVWLDPQPIDADLPLLYEQYYTHQGRDKVSSSPTQTPLRTRVLRLPLEFVYSAFLTLSGTSSARQRTYGLYLADRPPGRLLEIGCGSGELLAHFVGLGWEVVGQDVDPKAVDHARETHGVRVHLGPVESLPSSLGEFDVVIMNHVIEHVPNPVETLRQVAARLVPGGALVVVTPNMDSLGHRWFKSNWRGLEPPRHLHLFLPRTLERIAQQVGLDNAKVRTSAAYAERIAARSSELARKGRCGLYEPTDFWDRFVGLIFQFAALRYHSINRDSGEECFLFATAR